MKKKSTIPPKRTGRPTKYTDALADEICRRIAEGEMLMQIVRDEHMPERKTVYNWMNEHDGFLHNYARACEMSADALVEKGLEILDGSSPDCAQMDKNRAEYRKWLAGKRNARYGERQAVELTGANGGPVEMITECDEDRIASVMDRIEAIRRKRAEEENGGTV